MNTEDEIQYESRTGWHTFEILCAAFTADKGEKAEKRWRAWKGPHLIAQADTRDEVIEKAKRTIDQRFSP